MQDESQIDGPARRDFHILRLGWHDRANWLPLLYPLQAGWVGPESPWKVEVVLASQPELEKGLLNGSLEAAFVSPVAAQRHGARLVPLGGWGLATEGAVQTARLLAPSRLDLYENGDVALTPGAQGSTAEQMLRTLLKPYYDLTFLFHSPGEPGYDEAGARLEFSDRSCQEAQRLAPGWVAEDLGVAWFVLTGLPAVWEMLLARRDLELENPGVGAALQSTIAASQRAAKEQRSTIVQEGSSRLGLDEEQVTALFGRQRYSLGQAEQKGLAHFLSLASRAGALAGH